MTGALHPGPGRPLGSRDRYGRAHRVTDREAAIYRLRLSQRLADLMAARDLSASELAAGAGLHVRAVHRVLSPRRSDKGAPIGPSFDTLVRLARAMGLSPSELMP